MLKNLASRPGLQTSEWYVAAVTAILNLVNSSTGWITYKQAIPPTIAAIAYVISRGLAKYEPRNPPA
jgi:hypothetical protein